MKAHWQYFKHVLNHKRLVFQEVRRFGLPLWIAIFHDWSKFLPSEWFPYVDYFWRMAEFPKEKDVPMGALAGVGIIPKTKESVKEAFLYSCELHYRRNKHHWNHWVKDGVADAMPEIYRREMLADWWAVARALGNESPLAWYTMMRQEGRIKLHPETLYWTEGQLGYKHDFQEWDRAYCRWTDGFFEVGSIVKNPDVEGQLGFQADYKYRRTYTINDGGAEVSILSYCIFIETQETSLKWWEAHHNKKGAIDGR